MVDEFCLLVFSKSDCGEQTNIKQTKFVDVLYLFVSRDKPIDRAAPTARLFDNLI
jgi:hypothetical protein